MEALAAAASDSPRIHGMVADVRRSADIQRVIEAITRDFGQLTILVNNAGIAPVAALAELDMAQFDDVFQVNVRGVVDTTRQALPLLRASRGVVINIASAVGPRPMPNLSIYAASKSAVSTLSKAWAKELAAEGIRVNSVSVGPIQTPIYDKAGLSAEAAREHVAAVSRLIPLGRFGTVDEVAAVVAFLASPRASYITAAEYAVDGGFAA